MGWVRGHTDGNQILEYTATGEVSQMGENDSGAIDAKIVLAFLSKNPDAKIRSMIHSGTSHLLIVYDDENDAPQ